MSNSDAWPSRQTLRSPYNRKDAMANTHLQPDTSPATIQKIANQMDKSNGGVQSISPDQNCQLLLAGMPDLQGAPEVSDTNSNDNAGGNRELDKLLALGYKPLGLSGGKWSEEMTNSPPNKNLLLE